MFYEWFPAYQAGVTARRNHRLGRDCPYTWRCARLLWFLGWRDEGRVQKKADGDSKWMTRESLLEARKCYEAQILLDREVASIAASQENKIPT